MTRRLYDALPHTAAALAGSPGEGVPDDAVFAALGDDLLAAKQNDSLYSVAKDTQQAAACCA